MSTTPTRVPFLQASFRRSLRLTVTKTAVACAVALPAAAQPYLDGAWSQVYGWPLIAVHAAMTPEGRVLTYGTKGDWPKPLKAWIWRFIA